MAECEKITISSFKKCIAFVRQGEKEDTRFFQSNSQNKKKKQKKRKRVDQTAFAGRI